MFHTCVLSYKATCVGIVKFAHSFVRKLVAFALCHPLTLNQTACRIMELNKVFIIMYKNRFYAALFFLVSLFCANLSDGHAAAINSWHLLFSGEFLSCQAGGG